VHVVSLSFADRGLLAARFARHGNSHRRMRASLLDAGANDAVARLDALRELERRFEVDLGSVSWRYERREEEGTHPLERYIIDYIAEMRRTDDDEVLWVRLDRVREIRDLMEGRLVGEPGS
jgi:hypothetical protein